MSESPGPLSKQAKTLSENTTGITIFSKTDPRSVYNLVPVAMQEAMDQVDPKFYEFKFGSIEKHMKPDIRDYQLRVAFWREYNHTQDNWKRSISLHAVMKGICSADYLWKKVLKDPMKVAFLLYPVVDMQASMEEMMDLSLREMRKILKMPNNGAKGANMPVIREKIKIFALIQNRLQGSVLQRVAIDQRVQANINTSTTTQEAPKSLQEINREIKQIERTSKQAAYPSGGQERKQLETVAPEDSEQQKPTMAKVEIIDE